MSRVARGAPSPLPSHLLLLCCGVVGLRTDYEPDEFPGRFMILNMKHLSLVE